MSEQQLRQMIEYASGFAETAFVKRGVLYPMWHCVTASGETFITPPPSPDKDVGVMLMRALFELKDVVRYVYIDEAWTLTKPVDRDELDRMQKHGVRSHPDRVEIVMFSGEDHECGQLMAMRHIIRPKTGRAHLGPLAFLEDLPQVRERNPGSRPMQSEGRMVGLLPVRGMRQ